MKILHIYKDYPPILGGIENHIKTLAELQAAAGHQVTVLVANSGGRPRRERVNGVNLIRLWRLATVASTPLSPTFLTAIPRQRPDIAHLHFPYPIGEVSQWLVGKRPYVITYHSDIVRQRGMLSLYRPVLWRVLRAAARILPTSDRYISTSPFLSELRENCTVVPLSVDPAPYADATPLIPAGELPTLLFVGRHRYYKGVDDLIRAMPGIQARLLIGGDGPKRSSWERLAGELGLGEQVRFLGHIPEEDLAALYASADIFVLPANSRAEAFGKVLLEAMAAGKPCVTTEVGAGTSYVVQHGVTGLIAPPRNPAALAEALKILLGDAGLRQRMGEAGRARVLAEFTPAQLLRRTEAVYQAILD